VDIASHEIEIQDRVANDLAGTVVGDVAAAVGLVESNTLLAKDMFTGKKIGAIAAAAESENVRMLAEEQNVVDCACFAGGYDAFLQSDGVGKRDETNVDDEKSFHG
jgi:hypothetical protein